MDDLKGEVVDEKVHERALWHDILSADPDCEDALLRKTGLQNPRAYDII